MNKIPSRVITIKSVVLEGKPRNPVVDGCSRVQLAEFLQINRSTISRYEVIARQVDDYVKSIRVSRTGDYVQGDLLSGYQVWLISAIAQTSKELYRRHRGCKYMAQFKVYLQANQSKFSYESYREFLYQSKINKEYSNAS